MTTPPEPGPGPALAVDEDGNIEVGGDLHAVGDLHVGGDIAAATLHGNGTAIATANATPLQHALDAKFDKAGGTITGSLAVTKGIVGGLSIDAGLTVRGTQGLTVEAGVVAANVQSTNLMRHRMYPADPIALYDDVFDAQSAGAITKLGNPTYDDTTWKTERWKDRRLICFGKNSETDGNGAVLAVPQDCRTIWLRLCGERRNIIKAYYTDGAKEHLGLWGGGGRYSNSYCPDGSLSDGWKGAHQWLPIPVPRGGSLALISKPYTSSFFWISGVAFSKNPWGHAAASAMTIGWNFNGTGGVGGYSIWGGDVLASLPSAAPSTVATPVVNTGRDKLFYLVNNNDDDNGMTHTALTVNGTKIERLIATYDTPFARHWNSKFYDRYAAARIPAALIPGAIGSVSYLKVAIDRTKQDDTMYFREVGTHDLDVPYEP